MMSASGQAPLKHIVIVGGGTAGWMTAAALGHFLRASPTKVSLVESDEIGIIGVGEATLPLIEIFNRLIGINEVEFLRQTQGTFKLAIQFVDWGRKGHSYFHPFSAYGQNFDACDFHHHWLKAEAAGHKSAIEDYNLGALLARDNRFNARGTDPRSPMAGLPYAFHFDASLYARFLRGHAEKNGVTRIEGKITGVPQHSETGFVTGVTLENGTTVEGDFFVDCSGFRGLLIEQALKTGYNDWTGLLPCDRAVAVPCESASPLTPYTRATARDSGWQWRIPLQHRIGNGYVYSSQHISDDEASRTLLGHLDGKPLADPRIVRFQTGRRTRAWNKNVVAIGLSAGFLEPLESTSIHLIQKGVTKLLKCLPDCDFAPELRDEFNRQTAFDYEDVRDFLVMHYKLTAHEDTPFWAYNKYNTVSESLRDRMALFEATGRIFINEHEVFKTGSWLAVMLGQGLRPRRYDPMADALPIETVVRNLDLMRDILARTVVAQPDHAAFIAQHVAARQDA